MKGNVEKTNLECHTVRCRYTRVQVQYIHIFMDIFREYDGFETCADTLAGGRSCYTYKMI